MSLTIEVGHESDGRWLAEARDIPGVMSYGQSAEEAVGKTKVLALRAVANCLEHGEPTPHSRQLFRVIPVSQTDEVAHREACWRFERHFGEVSSGRSDGADNESIDADLAREYGNNHETT
ncbi:MAG: type II toxin-antitoxin system HicB family antitoxin [Planctomycetaceae bacterium]